MAREAYGEWGAVHKAELMDAMVDELAIPAAAVFPNAPAAGSAHGSLTYAPPLPQPPTLLWQEKETVLIEWVFWGACACVRVHIYG